MNSNVYWTCAATLLAALGATVATSAATAGEPEWIRQFGSGKVDRASAVASGTGGRVHVVGYTEGVIGPSAKGDGDAFVVTFDASGNELWRRQPGTSEFDDAEAVATDADGSVYVAGQTGGSLAGSHQGNVDAFLIKFDADGRIVWKRQPGTAATDIGHAVATDADRNVYLAGETNGSLGGSNKGGFDAFLIKYDRDGRLLWRRQIGTTGFDFGKGVATDAQGAVFVAGETDGSLGRTQQGNGDPFVIKFDADGRILWKRQPGTGNIDSGSAVATDSLGNVFLIGSTLGNLGGPIQGHIDPFVIGFDRDGTRTWRGQPGTPESDYGLAGAADTQGNVYVAGFSGASYVARVTAYDRTGSIIWKDQLPATSYAYGAAADTADSLYVTGTIRGALPGNFSHGGYDAYLIKYGPNGPQ